MNRALYQTAEGPLEPLGFTWMQPPPSKHQSLYSAPVCWSTSQCLTFLLSNNYYEASLEERVEVTFNSDSDNLPISFHLFVPPLLGIKNSVYTYRGDMTFCVFVCFLTTVTRGRLTPLRCTPGSQSYSPQIFCHLM